jgi:hypothetical protein
MGPQSFQASPTISCKNDSSFSANTIGNVYTVCVPQLWFCAYYVTITCLNTVPYQQNKLLTCGIPYKWAMTDIKC